MMAHFAAVSIVLAAGVALMASCGDDTGGSGGGADACAANDTLDCVCNDGTDGTKLCVDGSFSPCTKDGVGCADSGEGCADGDTLTCSCVDGSEGTKTCTDDAFSPCTNGSGDCSH